jgi:hypothetical protein
MGPSITETYEEVQRVFLTKIADFFQAMKKF